MAMEPFLACSVPALLSILITLDCSHGKQKPSDESEMGAADFSEINLFFFSSKSIKNNPSQKKTTKTLIFRSSIPNCTACGPRRAGGRLYTTAAGCRGRGSCCGRGAFDPRGAEMSRPSLLFSCIATVVRGHRRLKEHSSCSNPFCTCDHGVEAYVVFASHSVAWVWLPAKADANTLARR